MRMRADNEARPTDSSLQGMGERTATEVRPRPRSQGQTLHPVNQRRGKSAKITEAQAEMIRGDPRTDAAIAREYGLDASYVWRLKAGKRRRRLPPGTVVDVAPLPR